MAHDRLDPRCRPRRIGEFTATRSENGLLSGLLRQMARRRTLDLRLIVSGTHLSPEYGTTREHVDADGFAAAATVETVLSGDSPVAAAKSLGLAVMGVAEALDRIRPDLLVVLGDRYEALAAAQAAVMLSVPIAHIGGGESSEGAMDESFRHAITKLAHLHFVAAAAFADRVVQLGEDPTHVHVAGALGVDNALHLPLLSRVELEAEIGMTLTRPTVLATFHPVTLAAGGMSGLDAVLTALDRFPRATVAFTEPNADPRGREIRHRVRAYADARRPRVKVFTSLGPLRYLSLLSQCDVVVGNSSSGIIEAPALGVPTVNVGDRQRGRLRPESVLDAGEDAADVEAAIARALDPGFRERVRDAQALYGDGRAAERIVDVLAVAPLGGLLRKRFHPVAAATTPSGAET
jgi:UDP-hydrolysing UDP-N-acetyl-D-glucosamine 2-epimerase